MNDAEAERDLLAEQIAHYRAIAGEYEDHAITDQGAAEVTVALEADEPLRSPGA